MKAGSEAGSGVGAGRREGVEGGEASVRFSPEAITVCGLCGSKRLENFDVAACITKCLQCGYMFANPRPTPEELTVFYSQPEKYESWLALGAPRDRLWIRRLRQMERHKKAGSLLDVGTGIGQFLHHARGCYTMVCGTEVSSEAIAVARERYDLEIFPGAVDQLDLPAESFDNVTLFHVLEHVHRPRDLIGCCHRLLSPGGTLFVAVPNDGLVVSRGYRRLARLHRALCPPGRRPPASPGPSGLPKLTLDGSLHEIHLSHFSIPVLRALLEDTGFSIVQSSCDPYFVATGARELGAIARYAVTSGILRLTGRNFYRAIWMAATKQ